MGGSLKYNRLSNAYVNHYGMYPRFAPLSWHQFHGWLSSFLLVSMLLGLILDRILQCHLISLDVPLQTFHFERTFHLNHSMGHRRALCMALTFQQVALQLTL